MVEKRIVIVGAGIGGSALGAILRRRGLAVTLLDRNSKPPRHSYGITLERSTFTPLLAHLNVNEKSFVAQVLQPTITGRNKHILRTDLSAIRVTHASFEDFLRRDLDVQWGSTVTSVDHSSSPISVGLEDGQTLSADILVGADGVHSAVCQSLMPNESLHVLPFAVFNGRTSMPLQQGQDLAELSAGEDIVHAKLVGSSRLAYSIYKYGEEKATVDFTYSRPAVPNDRLHNPDRPTTAARDIPEELFTELDRLQPLPDAFAKVFDASAVRDARLLHWLMRHRLLQRPKLNKLGDSGVIFIGDAAHALPILGGNGANEALLDAMRLAEVLSGQVNSAAKTFYSDRYDDWILAAQRSQRALQEMHSCANSVL